MQLRPKIRLPTLLIGVNLAVLIIAIVGIATVAIGLLLELGDDQGLARVRQGVAIAQNDVQRSGNEVLTTAQLLAERPTLARLLQTNDQVALEDFLGQFQATSELAGCAIYQDGQLLIAVGTEIPAMPALDNRALLLDGALLGLAARVPLATDPSVIVAVWIELDQQYQAELSTILSLPVAIVPQQRLTNPNDPLTETQAAALTTNTITDSYLRDQHHYIASAPLLASTGQPIGVVSVTLPDTQIRNSAQRLSEVLLTIALVGGVLAFGLNLLVGRYVGWPLRRLTMAAAQIGRGDLTTPVAPAKGVEVGMLAGTLEDMRQRLRGLTADLQRQQAEANAILAGIVEGVFTVDRDRRIRYLNQQAASMLGIAPEQAIGRFCGDVLQPQLVDGVRPCEQACPIIHARFRGQAQATEHLQLLDGRRRTVIITSAGDVEQNHVQVMRDETDIETSRRLRDTILATISHEFRTPLSAQLASLELLLDQLPQLSTAQIRQLIVSLQRGALRLTYLIDNLLESARIEAGQLTIRRSEIALDGVVEAAVELMLPLIEQRRQQVEVDLPYPLPNVAGDATRLTQVFVNLLANASKFSPPDTTIAIGGEVTSEHLLVWVEDEGPGMPPSPSESPFRLFVRGRNEPEQSGAGLGLWIVQSIIERHNGRIHVPARSLGTRIVIELPRGTDEDFSR
ncbi:MAG TPA: PAS domain-containing sensor histidine kinase [Herpetosiphon sp.]|uniref:histidine kinase n=1 Tax=Herpetosiphon aurantiacus (strain ATCC 23779 / DSM 785 / 114-95) TaxID=316274 RepID=A9B2W3_HERA2|nr:ATP-binding protein [Herpetosiphon sp.]ABX06026.1 multi-sensor signal transduction histidine kinase [Herpetosiphon aurantiacus DSM 785]HBW49468.1 PAS domain-containing sensor histidine kinase [Herpetosiphon sp.]